MQYKLLVQVVYAYICTQLFSLLAVDCGPLSAPDNGQIQILNTTLGSPAVYSCNIGFNRVGTSRRVCTDSGNWSDTAPECQRKSLRDEYNYDEKG